MMIHHHDIRRLGRAARTDEMTILKGRTFLSETVLTVGGDLGPYHVALADIATLGNIPVVGSTGPEANAPNLVGLLRRAVMPHFGQGQAMHTQVIAAALQQGHTHRHSQGIPYHRYIAFV